MHLGKGHINHAIDIRSFAELYLGAENITHLQLLCSLSSVCLCQYINRHICKFIYIIFSTNGEKSLYFVEMGRDSQGLRTDGTEGR